MQKALVPVMICWDKSVNLSCGATRLGAFRALSAAYQHTHPFLTKQVSVFPTRTFRSFGSPSEVHSHGPFRTVFPAPTALSYASFPSYLLFLNGLEYSIVVDMLHHPNVFVNRNL